MTRSRLKLALKIVGGFLLALVVAAVLFLWRLSSSPMQLNEFIPRIEQVATNLPGGFSVKLKGVGLFWNREERGVDLKLVDVDLIDADGTRLVNAPEINVSLSVFALLHGVVALSSIELTGVGVKLVVGADGTYHVLRKPGAKAAEQSGETSPGESPDLTQVTQTLFKILQSEADPKYPLSYLKRVKVQGVLDVEDRVTGVSWSADSADSMFTGKKGAIKGNLSLSFSAPAALAGTRMEMDLDVQGESVGLNLDISGLQPSRLAQIDQRLQPLAGLDLVLNGTISTSFTLPDTFHGLEASFNSLEGTYSQPDFFSAPVKFNSVDLKISADLAHKAAQLTQLDVSLGEKGSPLQLQVTGSGQLGEGSLSLAVETLLQQLSVDEINRYWPQTVAKGARKWLVNNLKAGQVDNAKLDLAMAVPIGPESDFQLKKLEGTIAYSGLTVAYFGSLPAATGVKGSGTFDRHGFDLGVSAGMVNGISIDSGKVLITGLDNKKAAISVATHLTGGLGEVAVVLEAPPLLLDRFTPFTPAQLGGQVEADFSIALPLRAGLQTEEINYRGEGKISAGVLRQLFRDYGVQSANVDFQVDKSMLKMTGPLEFAGIPLTFDWTTQISGVDKGHSDFTVKAPHITAKEITALGYDVHDKMQGGFTLNAIGNVEPDGRASASIESDLASAELALPKIYWRKPAGAPASFGFTLLLEADHIVRAEDIKIDLGTISNSGKAAFDLAGPQLTVEHLQLSNGWVSDIVLKQNESRSLALTIGGGELNLEAFLLENSRERSDLDRRVIAESQVIHSELQSAGIRLEVEDSKLDKVFINKDTYFDTLRFSAVRDVNGLQELNLSGHNPYAGSEVDSNTPAAGTGRLKSGQFQVVFGPESNGQHPLHVEVENLGSLVSALKGKKIMDQGYLVLDGQSAGPMLREPIQSTFRISSFTLNDVPGMAQVLNLASLNQIVATLSQTGLAFNSWSGDLELDGTRLASRKMILNGGSLGLDVNGWLDFKQARLDVSGSLVPMYKLNKVVGKIPLIGQVVAGVDGKGVFVFGYTIKGSLEQPDVTVNKGLLTPGILRDISNAGEKPEGELP